MRFYNIPQLDNTGLVKTVYTPREFPRWRYGEETALENYEALGKLLDITPFDMVRPSQTHTLTVRAVDGSHAGNGVVRLPDQGDCDGLVTNVPGLLLCTREADCIPVYLLDPVQKAIGMIHSGWRGTCGEIVKIAIDLMEDTYGTKASDLLVAFGPNICQKCYEVGPELKENFSVHFLEDICTLFKAKGNGKYLLDVAKGVTITLKRCGVKEENIFPSTVCTFENEEFSSYRREHSYYSHMLTAIMLTK